MNKLSMVYECNYLKNIRRILTLRAKALRLELLAEVAKVCKHCFSFGHSLNSKACQILMTAIINLLKNDNPNNMLEKYSMMQGG
jgi:hypothetical protein